MPRLGVIWVCDLLPIPLLSGPSGLNLHRDASRGWAGAPRIWCSGLRPIARPFSVINLYICSFPSRRFFFRMGEVGWWSLRPEKWPWGLKITFGRLALLNTALSNAYILFGLCPEQARAFLFTLLGHKSARSRVTYHNFFLSPRLTLSAEPPPNAKIL